MSDYKSDLTKAFLKKKALTDSTLTTYVSVVWNLAKKLGGGGELERDMKKIFNNARLLMKSPPFHEYSLQSRTTILSALYMLTGRPAYRNGMMKSSAEVKESYQQQVKDVDRGKGVSLRDIENIHSAALIGFHSLPSVKSAVDAFITGVMTGVYKDCPPRRLLDYSEMKYRRYVAGVDNYIDENFVMHFNEYKTSKVDKKKGVRTTLQLPTALRPVVEYLKSPPNISPFDNYLLGTAERVSKHDLGILQGTRKPTKHKLTSSNLHKYLRRLFGFGVDELRSIYLSEVYKDTPSLASQANLASQMGHTSNAAQLFYVKK